MAKLSTAQALTYSRAEDQIRAGLGDGYELQCLWEITKPKGTRFAIMAGFAAYYRGTRRYFILQVYDTQGWEIFAAPSSIDVPQSLSSIRTMWDSHPKVEG